MVAAPSARSRQGGGHGFPRSLPTRVARPHPVSVAVVFRATTVHRRSPSPCTRACSLVLMSRCTRGRPPARLLHPPNPYPSAARARTASWRGAACSAATCRPSWRSSRCSTTRGACRVNRRCCARAFEPLASRRSERLSRSTRETERGRSNAAQRRKALAVWYCVLRAVSAADHRRRSPPVVLVLEMTTPPSSRPLLAGTGIARFSTAPRERPTADKRPTNPPLHPASSFLLAPPRLRPSKCAEARRAADRHAAAARPSIGRRAVRAPPARAGPRAARRAAARLVRAARARGG